MRSLLLVLILALGCTQVGKDMQRSDQAVTTPPRAQAHRLTHGEALYLRHCADCHGWEGRGGGPVAGMLGIQPPSLRRPELWAEYSAAELTAKVLYGRELSVPLDAPTSIASNADVTAITAYLRRFPSIPWEQVNRGQGLYDSLCVYCHGLYGRGDGIMAQQLPAPPRDLTSPDYQSQVSEADLRRIIANGKGAMPGVGDLMDAEQQQDVVAYVRVLSPGHELYTRFCAVCHGIDGHPPEMDTEAIGEVEAMPEVLPQVTFNQAYFRMHSEEHIRRGVRHMLQQSRAIMPHFAGELSKEQVGEILSYLRGLR
ncbi:MAG TPA: c-type cytochrome [Candidatus Tectomicrobia bacterium]|nr:c-type cytochrome [Candidatus Tectomicrobia bacterium]